MHYLPAHIQWIRKNEGRYQSAQEFCDAFNSQFGCHQSRHVFITFCGRHGVYSDSEKFTPNQLKWLKANMAGVRTSELTKRFNSYFGTNRTYRSVYIALYVRGYKSSVGNKCVKGDRCYVPYKGIRTWHSDGKARRKYKYKENYESGKSSYLEIPEDVYQNNKIIHNCAEAYAEVRLCERKVSGR